VFAARWQGKTSNWIGDAAGVGDGVPAISSIAVNNSRGSLKIELHLSLINLDSGGSVRATGVE
jgi:hypothetical protein